MGMAEETWAGDGAGRGTRAGEGGVMENDGGDVRSVC
jgi:hypothetical protein